MVAVSGSVETAAGVEGSSVVSQMRVNCRQYVLGESLC